jgi:formate hydrogenlyase transcriptional activator
MDALVRYAWPGNVRELQNIIERAVILSTGTALHVPLSDLQPGCQRSKVGPDAAVCSTPDGTSTKPITLADAERQHILGVLRETNWVLGGANGAAAHLGMKRSTLQWKIKKLGISWSE